MFNWWLLWRKNWGRFSKRCISLHSDWLTELRSWFDWSTATFISHHLKTKMVDDGHVHLKMVWWRWLPVYCVSFSNIIGLSSSWMQFSECFSIFITNMLQHIPIQRRISLVVDHDIWKPLQNLKTFDGVILESYTGGFQIDGEIDSDLWVILAKPKHLIENPRKRTNGSRSNKCWR